MQVSGFWYIQSCATISTIRCRTLSPPPPRNFLPLAVFLSFPFNTCPSSTRQPLFHLLSLQTCLFWTFHINGITRLVDCRDWLFPPWLISFSSFIHVAFFLLVNTFPLYGYITSDLSIHRWAFGLSAYYEFCYNEDSRTRFFCRPTFFFPLVRYAEVEWMSHTVMLCLIFWGTAKLFPQVAAPFDTPASKIWGSNLSTVLSMLVTVFFYYRHLNEWAVVPHCGFCLYFPND